MKSRPTMTKQMSTIQEELSARSALSASSWRCHRPGQDEANENNPAGADEQISTVDEEAIGRSPLFEGLTLSPRYSARGKCSARRHWSRIPVQHSVFLSARATSVLALGLRPAADPIANE